MHPSRLLSSLLPLLVLGSGCNADIYGPSVAPTASQREALDALGTVASTIERASRGQATAEELLAAHGRIALLSDRALLRSWPVELPAGGVSSFNPSCARGSPETGFIYDDCLADGVPVRGQVKVSPTEIRFELEVSSPTDPSAGYVLEGPLRFEGGRVVGRLEFASTSSTVTLHGVTVQSGPPGISTVTVWDSGLAQGRLNSGSVEVQVSTHGGQDEALFDFNGDAVTVRNSADLP
jgi:hypothetical protein